MEVEDDIYTSLAELNSLPLSTSEIMKMNARIESTTSKCKLQVLQPTSFHRH